MNQTGILECPSTSELQGLQTGSEVKVAGWIEDFRDIGKLGFISLRIRAGLVQTVLVGENLQKSEINS